MPEREEISLVDSLSGEWLKLLVAAMKETGPAAQTLAGIMRITARETYVPLRDIATRARLPAATVRKHIQILHAAGWIDAKGRQTTRRGWLRRTCTVALTKKTKDALRPDIPLDGKSQYTFGFLPWWACCHIRSVGKLPWCAKAVLSVVMARLVSLNAATERQDGEGLSADDLEGSIENMGGDDRFRFSITDFTKQTGLTRESVVSAKRLLNHRFGILDWCASEISPKHLLVPNWNFRVVVTPAPDGGCFLGFERGSESGQ